MKAVIFFLFLTQWCSTWGSETLGAGRQKLTVLKWVEGP